MPLTQARMEALVRAGQDYKQALLQLCEMVHLAKRRPDPTFEITQLAFMADPNLLLKDSSSSATALALEAEHLRTTKTRNAWRRNKIAQQRAATAFGSSHPRQPSSGAQGPQTFSSSRLSAEQLAMLEQALAEADGQGPKPTPLPPASEGLDLELAFEEPEPESSE